MILRYWYLLKGSWPRMLELAYWPTVQMVIWGLMTKHLIDESSWVAQAAGVLISAVLLWDVLFRGQLGMSLSFLEEMWSRNMGHLFVSPLRPYEWVVSMMAMSLIRTLIGVVPAAVLAFFLWQFNILSIGLPLLAFFSLLLITGWWMAMVIIALIPALRHGGRRAGVADSCSCSRRSARSTTRSTCCPASSSGSPMRCPPAHVFEGMRAVMFGEAFPWGHLAAAMGLNAVYKWRWPAPCSCGRSTMRGCAGRCCSRGSSLPGTLVFAKHGTSHRIKVESLSRLCYSFQAISGVGRLS